MKLSEMSMMPFDIFAERALLGLLMANPQAFEAIACVDFEGCEFYRPDHAAIFRLIKKRILTDQSCSPSEIYGDTDVASIVSADYLVGLLDLGKSLDVSKANSCASVIYWWAIRRIAIKFATEICGAVADTRGPASWFAIQNKILELLRAAVLLSCEPRPLGSLPPLAEKFCYETLSTDALHTGQVSAHPPENGSKH